MRKIINATVYILLPIVWMPVTLFKTIWVLLHAEHSETKIVIDKAMEIITNKTKD